MAVNANTGGSATNTYFFGSGGGKDTIDFGTQMSAFSTDLPLRSPLQLTPLMVQLPVTASTSSTGKLSFGNSTTTTSLSRYYWYLRQRPQHSGYHLHDCGHFGDHSSWDDPLPQSIKIEGRKALFFYGKNFFGMA